MRANLKSRTAKHPLIWLALLTVAIFINSCRTDEVQVPPLTGPSGHRLFITMDAAPDHLLIRKPGKPREKSLVTAQLKNQLGQGVPNVNIKFRIANSVGTEISIGTLDRLSLATDSGGFARVTYSAPNSGEQPVPTRVYIFAIMTDPAYTFEVTGQHALDLESGRPVEGCIFNAPGAPEAKFTISPNPAVKLQQVCFDAQSSTDADGQIIAASWDFGDGNSGSGLVVCHEYENDGIFNVTLTVQDDDHNCDSITQAVTVGVGTGPTCSFTISPNPVNTDTTVNFDASASSDVDGSITSYKWSFGDGGTGSGKTTTHQYTNTGTFTVTLTVRDNAGNETICTQTVTVTTGAPDCSTFTVSPANPDANQAVTFDASSVTDPDGGTVTFEWDFGDLCSAPCDTGSVVTHTYTSPGSFVVKLTATDDEGNVVNCSKSVIVGNLAPTCSFSASAPFSTAPCDSTHQNQCVTFTSTSSDPDGGAANPCGTGLATCTWDFGDGGTDSGSPVTHLFAAAGPPPGSPAYGVTLTVTDSDSPPLSTTCPPKSVTISGAPPTAAFSGAASGCAPLTVNLNASTSTDNDEGGSTIVSYLWDFGDGSTLGPSSSASVSHTYSASAAGDRTITLTVTDDEGQTDQEQATITVGAIPTLTSATNATACVNADGVTHTLSGTNFDFTGTSFDVSAVTYDGTTPAESFTIVTSTTITSNPPALGSGSHTVTVTNSCGTSGSATFTCP